LLFSCSVNICADWEEKELRTILDVAKNLKNILGKKIDLKNIKFVEEENYEDSWTTEMHEIFAKFYNVVKLKDV
jgi:predicted nucleotidyltransferase